MAIATNADQPPVNPLDDIFVPTQAPVKSDDADDDDRKAISSIVAEQTAPIQKETLVNGFLSDPANARYVPFQNEIRALARDPRNAGMSPKAIAKLGYNIEKAETDAVAKAIADKNKADEEAKNDATSGSNNRVNTNATPVDAFTMSKDDFEKERNRRLYGGNV